MTATLIVGEMGPQELEKGFGKDISSLIVGTFIPSERSLYEICVSLARTRYIFNTVWILDFILSVRKMKFWTSCKMSNAQAV